MKFELPEDLEPFADGIIIGALWRHAVDAVAVTAGEREILDEIGATSDLNDRALLWCVQSDILRP